jgi:branched-subunit amino acid ABC-type transport system permease component
MLRLAALSGIFVLLLSACSGVLDADQARICRTILPALNPPDTMFRIVRMGHGVAPATVRIDYRAVAPGGTPRERVLVCLFAGEGLSRNRQELTGIVTEHGPMAEAPFYFLRRFYLGSPDAALEDPGDLSRIRDVPDVPHWLAYAAQHAVGALPLASIYALLAASYALIYGLVGRIVFGFGQFAAIGGYAALMGVMLALQFGGGEPSWALALAGVLAVTAAAFHGVVVGRLVVEPLIRGPGLPVLIASTGLMIGLGEYLRLSQGNDLRWISPILNMPVPILRSGDFVTTLTPIALMVAGLTAIVLGGLMAMMKFTGFGRSWRAYSDDPQTAALFGVDPTGVFTASFALAAALAGFAGFVMTAYYGGVGYGSGLEIGLKALVAAVVGGIGSVGGALAGGLLIGVAEALWSATMPIESRDIAIYTLLVIVLTLRPGGLFGYGELAPRGV